MGRSDVTQLGGGAKALAIVSGKGGSGKTLVATVFAEALAYTDKRVLLVDADVGTGGLSYYLGFNIFGRIREGLTEYLLAENELPSPTIAVVSARDEVIRESYSFANIKLLPVGQHRSLRKLGIAITPDKLSALLNYYGDDFDYIIFDCRGGIDEDSVSVCQAVNDILVVVETDAASIQASQYLVDILSESGVGNKIVGFCLNKVMDDPSALAKTGAHFFNSEYLGAIPFDIETTRDFIRGNAPNVFGLFGRHVMRIISKVYSDADMFDSVPVLTNEEFGTVTLKEPNLFRGQAAFAFIFVFVGLGYLLSYLSRTGGRIYSADVESLALIYGVLVLALISLADGFKKVVGNLVRVFADDFGRVFRVFTRGGIRGRRPR